MSYNPYRMMQPLEKENNIAARTIDILLVGLSLWLSNLIQSESWEYTQSVAAGIGGLSFAISAHILGLYRNGRGGLIARMVKIVWLSWGVAFTICLLLAFASKTSADHSRRVMITWALLTPVILTTWRILFELLAQEAHTRGYGLRTTAIVGATPLGLHLANKIKSSRWMGLTILGFYDDRSLSRLQNSTELKNTSFNIMGSLQELVAAARNGEIDEIYIALPPRAEPRITELVKRLSDTTASIHLAYDFGGFDLLRAQWSNVGSIPVMSIVDDPFYGVDGLLKRLEDIILGSLILAIIAIPMLLIAIGIKLTSKGPVFFRQRRYGLNGDVVTVLKFRSMTVCEDGDNVVQAKKDDQRITPVGSILRRTSLDELPQFLQVVGGTMSIVGPRPHAVSHNEMYRSQIQGYMLRHKVKPGITGWAQVNGWRGETDTLEKMEKRVEYDLDYIRGWHLGFDIRIILLTIRQVVLGHSNAY